MNAVKTATHPSTNRKTERTFAYIRAFIPADFFYIYLFDVKLTTASDCGVWNWPWQLSA